MVVVNNGYAGDIQNALDLYLTITSINVPSNSDRIRRELFSLFEEEDESRSANYLSLNRRVSDDYKIEYINELKLVGEEEEYKPGVKYFEEEEEEEVESSQDRFYGDTVEYLEEEPEDSEVFVSVGCEEAIPEDDNALEKEHLELENNKLSDLRDTSDQKTSSYVSDMNSYDEDLEEGWGSSDDSEDFVEEDYVDEDEEDIVEDNSIFDEEWGSEEDIDDEPVVEEVIEDTVEESFKDIEDISFDESYISDVTEKIEAGVKVVNVETPENNQEVVEVPKDLRAFVKMYPSCDMELALKYFSRKEIEKQLMMGRVFKRKNKLLI